VKKKLIGKKSVYTIQEIIPISCVGGGVECLIFYSCIARAHGAIHHHSLL